MGCDPDRLCLYPPYLFWMRARFGEAGHLVDVRVLELWEEREDEPFQLRWAMMVLILEVI